MNLKVITARNSLIMGGVQFAMRPINFVIAVILARLLDPSDFGIVALALVLVQTSNQFTALGMDKAIIQSQEERGKIAFHAFVAVMIFGLLFFSLIQFNSALFAGWLGDGKTEPVLRWLSGWILLNALAVVPLALLRKDLHFHYIATAGLIAELVYTVVVIWMAYTGFGLWSLVYANLIKTGFNTIVYWVACAGWDWIIPRRWEWPVINKLLRYGSQASASGLVSYFHTHWDDWLVGRTLGVEQLGFYSKGYDFSNSTIGKLIRNTLGMVFLPSYAKIQENRQRLQRAYLKSVRLVFLLVVPVAFGIFIVSEPLVQVVFGDKWLPMVPALQIFALLIVTRPISQNTAPLFHAVGLPRNNLIAGLVLVAVMIPTVLWLMPWGIAGVAFGVGLSHCVGALFNVYQVNRIMPGSAEQTAKIALPILGTGLIMMAGVHLAKIPIADLFGTLFSIPALLTLIATGGVLYCIGLALTQRDIIVEVWQTGLALLPKRLPLSKSRA